MYLLSHAYEDVIFSFQQIRISDLGRPKDLSEVIYKSMAEMTILVTYLVVEFAKRLPGFQSLDKEDQILLLKVILVYLIKR